MSAKMNNSELLLAVVISSIYVVCWALFSIFFDTLVLFSMENHVPPAKLQFLIGFLYLSAICANCKDIRNGSGQWEKIETYICKHSDAEFSHGLCPDCDKELYGDRRMHFKEIASKYS
jgi:hypothetical protein